MKYLGPFLYVARPQLTTNTRTVSVELALSLPSCYFTKWRSKISKMGLPHIFTIVIFVEKCCVSVCCSLVGALRVFFRSNTLSILKQEVYMIHVLLHNTVSSATVSSLMLAPDSRRSLIRPKDPTLHTAPRARPQLESRVTSRHALTL